MRPDDARTNALSLIHDRLRAMFSTENTRIGVAHSTTETARFSGVDNGSAAQRDCSDWMFAPGCITKLFTAALLEDEVAWRRINIDDPVLELLRGKPSAAALDGVTIRHLLEHTHGLDDSRLDPPPVLRDGRIDISALLERLAGCRLAPPGEVYSYSNAGAWIAAALLERLKSRRFDAQLQNELFDPLGIHWRLQSSSNAVGHERICPATGGPLRISVSGMLLFLQAKALTRGDWPPGDSSGRITRLPGWNPIECGIYRGWKHHGDAWFGHSSIFRGESAMVRIEPRNGIAVVLTCKPHSVHVVAPMLFAGVLPEYRQIAYPKRLSPTAASKIDLTRYSGDYHSMAETLSLNVKNGSGLWIAGRNVDTGLSPAMGDVFYTQPSRARRFTFLQFLRQDKDGTFRYLWDGGRVFRRCDARGDPGDTRGY